MIDTAGNFQGKYHFNFTEGLTAKLQTMVKIVVFLSCAYIIMHVDLKSTGSINDSN